MRSNIFAFATAALMAFSLPGYAEDAVAAADQVSDAVDIAMFCGAAFTVAAKSETATAEEKAASDQMATLAFGRAKIALDADGIDEAEYDRLVQFYVDAAVADMTAGVEEMRYSADECVAEATAQ